MWLSDGSRETDALCRKIIALITQITSHSRSGDHPELPGLSAASVDHIVDQTSEMARKDRPRELITPGVVMRIRWKHIGRSQWTNARVVADTNYDWESPKPADVIFAV